MIPFYPVYLHTGTPNQEPPRAWPLLLAVGVTILVLLAVIG